MKIREPEDYIGAQIQESPFYDLSKRLKKAKLVKNNYLQLNQPYNPMSNLQNPGDYVKGEPAYKKYKFQKYDESRVSLSNKDHDLILETMITQYRLGLLQSKDFHQNIALKKLIIQNYQLLVKYQNNPRAFILLFQASRVRWIQKPQFSAMHAKIFGGNKQNYPLLTLEQAKFAFMGNISNYRKLFQQSIKYGQKAAFFFYASSQRKIGDHLKAYQIYKNGIDVGSFPCYLGLAKLYCLGNPQLPKNPELSVYYYQKFFQTPGYSVDSQNLNYYHIMKNQILLNQQRSSQIVSTQQTQAEVVSDFLKIKLQQSKINIIDSYNPILQDTQQQCNEQSFAFIKKPKIFYVVFSPLMGFPSRGFLAQDENGAIQCIYVYGWDQIPTKKLKLLHKLGTKVTLKHYIRKFSSYSKLPMIRVQNASWIQIEQGKEKHSLSNKRLRQFGIIMFKKDQYMKALPIYTCLILRKAQQMEIIYSNIGLAYQKLNKIELAIKYYKKSISIKDYLKSKQRLFYLYINTNKTEEAVKILDSVTSQSQRKQMQASLQQIEKRKQSKVDYSEKIFIKKRNKIMPSIHFEGYDLKPDEIDFGSGLSLKDNFNNYKNFFIQNKGQFTWFQKNKAASDKQFLQKLKKLYEMPESSNLTSISPGQIQQFFCFWNDCSWFYKRNIYNFLYIELFQLMESKKYHLQKRLLIYCNRLEENQRYDQALKIYLQGKYMSDIFTLRGIQLLIQMGELQRAQKNCMFRRAQLNQMEQNDTVTYYHMQYQVLWVKIKIKKKQYKKVFEFENADREKFLLQPKHFGDTGSDPIQISMSKIINKQRLLYTIACAYAKNFEKALKLIENGIQNKSKIEVQNYYELRMLKIKILKNANSYEKALEQINKVTVEIFKQKQAHFQNKHIFKKAFDLQKLTLLIKNSKINQILSLCQQIVKMSAKNLIFVEEQLFNFAYNKKQLCIQIIQKLKQSSILKCLFQNLFLKMQTYLKQDLKQSKQAIPKNVLQKLLPYFQIKQQADQKANLKLEQEKPLQMDLNEGNQDEIVGNFYQYEYKQWQKAKKQESHMENYGELIEDGENSLANACQGFVCSFFDSNGVQCVVVFDPNMKLQVQQEKKFILAANKICRKNLGYNGIKFMEDGTLRLKIHGQARLSGVIIQKTKTKSLYFFNKRQNHNDYIKRK